jgi:protoporphyrinogen/coproporphyrinogen III oxidase
MRAVVIGGGIAGLASARRLAQAGHEVVLLEAADRLGGLIQSVELDGVRVDVGAEAFAVARPEALELVQELGLEEFLAEPAQDSARILVDGRFVRIPHGVLGVPSNLDSAEVLEAIGASAVAEAKRLDALPWNTPAGGSMADLVRDRLGEGVLRTLVAPVVAGVHASDPSLLEADVVAPGLYARAAQLGSLSAAAAAMRATAARPGAAVSTLTGGMTSLIAALERAVTQAGVTLRLGTPAHSVWRTPDGYQVVLDNEAHERLNADILVAATPPHVASQLLGSMPSVATPLAQIRTVDVTVVALSASSESAAMAPLGSGVLVAPTTTGLPTIVAKASTHATAKWAHLAQAAGPNGHLIRLSYGRDGQAPKANQDLLATAREDAAALYGLKPKDFTAGIAHEWPRSLVQARPGHNRLVVELTAALQNLHNLHVVGAGLGGNGIAGILAQVKRLHLTPDATPNP